MLFLRESKMKKFWQRYWFLTLLSFLAAVAVFWKFWLFPSLPPTLIRVTPPAGSLSTALEKMEIEMGPLGEKQKRDLSLLTIPSLSFTTQWQNNKLIVSFQPALEEAGKYLFELRYRQTPLFSWSYQLSFPSPTPVPERGDPEIKKEILQETAQQYPLIDFVPYEDENFYLNYLGPLKLGVKIKRGERRRVKWKVYEWLEEKGVDPDSHQIIWLNP